MHVKPAIEGAGTLTCIMNTVSSVPPPALTEELLTRLDIPGPRYTSYPTSDRFVEAFTAEHYRQALALRGEGGFVLVEIRLKGMRCPDGRMRSIVSKLPEEPGS